MFLVVFGGSWLFLVLGRSGDQGIGGLKLLEIDMGIWGFHWVRHNQVSWSGFYCFGMGEGVCIRLEIERLRYFKRYEFDNASFL